MLENQTNQSLEKALLKFEQCLGVLEKNPKFYSSISNIITLRDKNILKEPPFAKSSIGTLGKRACIFVDIDWWNSLEDNVAVKVILRHITCSIFSVAEQVRKFIKVTKFDPSMEEILFFSLLYEVAIDKLSSQTFGVNSWAFSKKATQHLQIPDLNSIVFEKSAFSNLRKVYPLDVDVIHEAYQLYVEEGVFTPLVLPPQSEDDSQCPSMPSEGDEDGEDDKKNGKSKDDQDGESEDDKDGDGEDGDAKDGDGKPDQKSKDNKDGDQNEKLVANFNPQFVAEQLFSKISDEDLDKLYATTAANYEDQDSNSSGTRGGSGESTAVFKGVLRKLRTQRITAMVKKEVPPVINKPRIKHSTWKRDKRTLSEFDKGKIKGKVTETYYQLDKEMSPAIVLIDTSGSCSALVPVFYTVMKAIAETGRPVVKYGFDTRIFKLKGDKVPYGGGAAYNGFNKIFQDNPEIEKCFVFTDGYGDRVNLENKSKWIFIIMDNHYQARALKDCVGSDVKYYVMDPNKNPLTIEGPFQT